MYTLPVTAYAETGFWNAPDVPADDRKKEKNVCIFSQTLIVDHEDRARKMRDNFYERPENIYRGMITLTEGRINYLFDD